MIAAARAVRVEVLRIDAVIHQILPRRAVLLDRTGRRDVIRRDAVAEQRQHAPAGDVDQRRGLERHALEERRIAHVGRIGIPLEATAGRHVKVLPARIAAEHVRVLFREVLGLHRAQHRLLNLALGRPDVAQVDRLSIVAGPERLGRQVQRHRAGECIGDDQRRRCEVVRANLLLHTAFEVAIAAQHRRDHQAARVDFRRHIIRQRAAVADARRASVADEVEAEGIEVGIETGLREIVRHDFRSRRQARLDPRFAGEALLHGLLRHEAGADHDARVRRVRAARDRGDDDRPVIDRELR